MSLPVKSIEIGEIESVLAKGDLSKLTEHQRADYYVKLCQSLGLNPLTQPFEYLTLNNKLVLYAKRACADQLRKINGISLQVVSQDYADGLFTVHVRAKDRDGREDEDLGVVSMPESLKGDGRANAILKAVTKAKRRVTLSISGLGFLDETEVADIPSSAKRAMGENVMRQPENVVLLPHHDPHTGEIAPDSVMASGGGVEKEPTIVSGGASYEEPTAAQENPVDWITYGQQIIASLKDASSAEIERTKFVNAQKMSAMADEAPKVHKRLVAALDKITKAAAEPPRSQANGPTPDADPEAYLKWLKAEAAKINNMEGMRHLRKAEMANFKAAFPPDREHAEYILKIREDEIVLANA